MATESFELKIALSKKLEANRAYERLRGNIMSASWNVYPFLTLSAENVLEALKVARCWRQS